MNTHKQLLSKRQHASYVGSKAIRDTVNWQPQSISACLCNMKKAMQTLGDNLAPTTNPLQLFSVICNNNEYEQICFFI